MKATKLIGAALLLAGSSAYAQTATSAGQTSSDGVPASEVTQADLDAQRIATLGVRGLAQAQIPRGSADSLAPNTSGDAARFILTASASKSSAALQLGTTSSYTHDAKPLEGYLPYRFYDETLTFTASSPLDDGRSFNRLDRLANGQKLSLNWSRATYRLPVASTIVAAKRAAAKAECLRRERLGEKLEIPCNNPQDSAYFAAYLSPEANRERQDLIEFAYLNQRFLFGFEGSIGYNQFKHYNLAVPDPSDPQLFANTTSNKIGWEAKGYVTLFPGKFSALTLSGGYQRAFEALPATIRCPVVAGATNVRCTNGAFGPPELVETAPVRAELRTWLRRTSGFLGRVAMQPSFTVDAISGDYEADLQLFLVPDDKGNLIGGIQGTYSSVSSFVVGVFVGTTFSLP